MLLTGHQRTALVLLVVAVPSIGLLGPLAARAANDEVTEIDLETANCFGHHAAETPPFRTTVLMVPQAILEVPANQEFDLPVQVQVAWKQEMRNLKIGLNLSDAPNLAFVGETHEDLSKDIDGTVDLGKTAEIPFSVADNATSIDVVLAGDEGPLGANDLDLFLVAPGATASYNGTGLEGDDNSLQGVREGKPIAHEKIHLSQSQVVDGGPGDWKAQIRYPNGTPAPDAFKLSIKVAYGGASGTHFLAIGRTLAAGEITNITFHLKALSPGPVAFRLASLGWAHYKHTDAQAKDDGNFTKDQRMSFIVGSTFKVQAGGAGLVDVSFDPVTKLMRQWGFLLGWLGFFLVGPSLVLGGTFGSRTVRGLNRFSGTARQRVLWHNALSYVLLAVGLTHMTLFLMEGTYNYTVGLVWGTLTLASIIGLGFTGALQNRIAKTYGYATWRFTHFMLGMLVIVFIALHVVVDGVDLAFLRDYFL